MYEKMSNEELKIIVRCYFANPNCIPAQHAAAHEAFEELANRLSSRPKDGWVSEWRPIETAPKDGSMFLAIRWEPGQEEAIPIAACWASYHPNQAGKSTWRTAEVCGDKCEYITHWMPLPAPPKGEWS